MNFFRSSVDPEKVALTVKGLAVFIPTLLVFLKYFNVNVGADDLNAVVDALANFVLVVGTVVSAAVVVYGAARKVYYKLLNK